MYIPPAFGPAHAHEEWGVYAPRLHQRVIAKLTGGLAPLYYRDQVISLEPLPETMLDEGKASPVPDLSLYDNETDQTPVVIEVCHTNGLKDDLRKIIRLLDEGLYGIREGFVYDYKTGKWLRYRQGDGGLATASSFSEVLRLDFDSFL